MVGMSQPACWACFAQSSDGCSSRGMWQRWTPASPPQGSSPAQRLSENCCSHQLITERSSHCVCVCVCVWWEGGEGRLTYIHINMFHHAEIYALTSTSSSDHVLGWWWWVGLAALRAPHPPAATGTQDTTQKQKKQKPKIKVKVKTDISD